MEAHHAECFLCPATSADALLHHIGYYDPNTNLGSDFHVCDFCFRVLCGGEDKHAAVMYRAYEEAVSAGYTPLSALQAIWSALRSLGWELRWAELDGRTYMVAIYRFFTGRHFALGVVSKKPAPGDWQEALESSSPRQQLKPCDLVGRYFALDGETGLPLAPPLREAAIAAGQNAFSQQPYCTTNPVDPFLELGHQQFAAGYELIRRWLI